jgi:ribose transport system substrate-binding protein
MHACNMTEITDALGLRNRPAALQSFRRAGSSSLALLAAACLLSACGTTGSTGTSESKTVPANKTLHLAYMSFAVQNSYDVPMLKAAQEVAAKNNAELTVFDAANTAQTQFTQMQDVIASGKYDGIMVQAVDGAGILPQVQQALDKGLKVVAFDQILGADLTTGKIQVPGVSAFVGFVPSEFGRKTGLLAAEACASLKVKPCNVGYLYDVKASSNGQALRSAFNEAIAPTPDIKVVAEGETFFTADGGLKAAQTMLQSHPEISVITGSDQGALGASQAVATAGKSDRILLCGNGGSAAGYTAIQSGKIYGTVTNLPASEGSGAAAALIKALREGKDSGSIDPSAALPEKGIVSKTNVSKFTAEWSG